jgi:glycosyltransferase involved in cell wall biosynthesis
MDGPPETIPRIDNPQRVYEAKLPITVIVPTKNEAANIGKCLASLGPAERVLVVDSSSADETARLARLQGAEVLSFDIRKRFLKKRQWALEHAGIATDWTLLVDADEVVPVRLWDEIARTVRGPHPATGYLVRKGFCFMGRPFRFGGFSHEAIVLFRTGTARFEQLDENGRSGMDMEIHERLIVDGRLARLKTPLIHQDLKGLAAYIDRHNQYSTWEAYLRHQFLTTGHWGADSIRPRLLGNVQERRRFLKQIACRIPCEHWFWFLYHYIGRLGFLEGRAGLVASQLRAQYIANVHAKMAELRLDRRKHSGHLSMTRSIFRDH